MRLLFKYIFTSLWHWISRDIGTSGLIPVLSTRVYAASTGRTPIKRYVLLRKAGVQRRYAVPKPLTTFLSF